ncbi:MAG: hypothetical protein RLO50_09820 [Azospirillaceae bacterium]
MHRQRMARRVASVLAGIALLGGAFAVSTRADQTDPRLDELFGQLQVAESAAEARAIEDEIWAIWHRYDGDARGVEQWMRLGQLWNGIGDRIQAHRYYTLVTEAAPDFAEGWNRRATVAYLLGDFAGSLEDIDRVLALEPRHFGALSGMGLVLLQLDRPEEALDAFERTVEVNPYALGAQQNIERLRPIVEGEPI